MQTVNQKSEPDLLECGFVRYLRMHPRLPAEQLQAEFGHGLRDLINHGGFEKFSCDIFAYYLGMLAAKNGMRVIE